MTGFLVRHSPEFLVWAVFLILALTVLSWFPGGGPDAPA